MLLFAGAVFAQNNKLAIDSLHVPGPILFEGKSYLLIQSSYTPDSATYNTYRQEYLPAGDTLDIYKSKILVCVFTGNAKSEDIANAKLDELRELKLTNSAVDFHPFNNKKIGEFMLDFLTTENSSDGQYIDVAERNIYRYLDITTTTGENCVLLFGISKRAYGDDVEKFMALLKSKARVDLIKLVGNYKLPDITILK